MEDVWDKDKVFEIYCIEAYNIILFDIYLSCFCFYFITSLFPDSVCAFRKHLP